MNTFPSLLTALPVPRFPTDVYIPAMPPYPFHETSRWSSLPSLPQSFVQNPVPCTPRTDNPLVQDGVFLSNQDPKQRDGRELHKPNPPWSNTDRDVDVITDANLAAEFLIFLKTLEKGKDVVNMTKTPSTRTPTPPARITTPLPFNISEILPDIVPPAPPRTPKCHDQFAHTGGLFSGLGAPAIQMASSFSRVSSPAPVAHANCAFSPWANLSVLNNLSRPVTYLYPYSKDVDNLYRGFGLPKVNFPTATLYSSNLGNPTYLPVTNNKQTPGDLQPLQLACSTVQTRTSCNSQHSNASSVSSRSSPAPSPAISPRDRGSSQTRARTQHRGDIQTLKRTLLGPIDLQKLVCDECGRTCKTNAGLKRHRRTVCVSEKQKRPQVCHRCSIHFESPHALSVHMDNCSGPPRQHECTRCAAAFRRKRDLDAHDRNVHGIPNKFQSKQCH